MEHETIAGRDLESISRRSWLGRADGSFEDTVSSARQKVVAAFDYSMPPGKRRHAKGSMHGWDDQLVALLRECLAVRRKIYSVKGGRSVARDMERGGSSCVARHKGKPTTMLERIDR